MELVGLRYSKNTNTKLTLSSSTSSCQVYRPTRPSACCAGSIQQEEFCLHQDTTKIPLAQSSTMPELADPASTSCRNLSRSAAWLVSSAHCSRRLSQIRACRTKNDFSAPFSPFIAHGPPVAANPTIAVQILKDGYRAVGFVPGRFAKSDASPLERSIIAPEIVGIWSTCRCRRPSGRVSAAS